MNEWLNLNGAPKEHVKDVVRDFYDLQKNPIVCPKCGVVFEPQATSRNRRSRLAVDTSKEITLDDNLLRRQSRIRRRS